jgi:NAD(P)-dependent dehydrogenase (short-subunit alcohol dehydrogenase family)
MRRLEGKTALVTGAARGIGGPFLALGVHDEATWDAVTGQVGQLDILVNNVGRQPGMNRRA